MARNKGKHKRPQKHERLAYARARQQAQEQMQAIACVSVAAIEAGTQHNNALTALAASTKRRRHNVTEMQALAIADMEQRPLPDPEMTSLLATSSKAQPALPPPSLPPPAIRAPPSRAQAQPAFPPLPPAQGVWNEQAEYPPAPPAVPPPRVPTKALSPFRTGTLRGSGARATGAQSFQQGHPTPRAQSSRYHGEANTTVDNSDNPRSSEYVLYYPYDEVARLDCYMFFFDPN